MSERNYESRRFHGDAARLRAPDRVARLEPERVAAALREAATTARDPLPHVELHAFAPPRRR